MQCLAARPLANLASDIELDTPLLRLEIPRENVMPIRTVGAGQFGLVFAVNVRDDAEGLSYERAAKVLRAGASPDTMANFLREAEVLRQLNHRNVVRLRGVCLRQQPWLIIEDYMLYVTTPPLLIIILFYLEVISRMLVGCSVPSLQGGVACRQRPFSGVGSKLPLLTATLTCASLMTRLVP